jgi:nicotinate-nucleotide--dimethylbenzimidazole phosphoribosyltransferase
MDPANKSREDEDPLNALTHATRDIAALFGAIIAARMAGVRVVLSGPAALAARDLLQALNPAAVGHCLEASPGGMDDVFGLTGAIALLQAEP